MKLTFKLLFSIIIIFSFLFSLYALGSYFLGIKAEQSINDEIKILGENSLLEVKSYHYKRGILSSAAVAEIVLRKNILTALNIDSFPEVLQKVLLNPVTLKTYIRHGPYCRGLLARACAVTEAHFEPEAEPEIIKFFATKNPVKIDNNIQFNGSGLVQFNLNTMDYKELSGIQIKFDGLSGLLSYQNNYSEYSWDVDVPKFYMKLADQGGVLLSGLKYQAKNYPQQDSAPTGSTRLQFNKLIVDTKLKRPVNFNLLNFLSPFVNIKLGYLFNPKLTFQGAKLGIDNFVFSLDSRAEKDLLALNGTLDIAALTLNNEKYGPLLTKVTVHNLHGNSVLSLKNYLTANNFNSEHWRDQLLRFLRGPAAPLFTNEPGFVLDRFYFKMPEGEIKMSGQIVLGALTAAELARPGSLLAKAEADLNYVIPAKVITNIVENQIINLFLSGKEAPTAADLKNVLRTTQFMIKSMIGNFAALNYTRLTAGILSGTVRLTQGKIYLNGKEYRPEEEDPVLDPDEDSFSSPAAALSFK